MPKLEAKMLRDDRHASIAEVTIALTDDERVQAQAAIATLNSFRRRVLDRVASIDEDDGVLAFDYRIEGSLIVTVVQVDAP